jgi:hypothetical protein
VLLVDPAEVGDVGDVDFVEDVLPQAARTMVANPAPAILATRRMDDGS